MKVENALQLRLHQHTATYGQEDVECQCFIFICHVNELSVKTSVFGICRLVGQHGHGTVRRTLNLYIIDVDRL